MRSFQRAVATSVATLALAAAGLAVAAPAAATPEDGKGCVGTPALPATYVCVISVTPENVVPGTTVTNVRVTVPRLCYFLDCTAEQVVDVPVPGVTPRTGVIATLWYQGQYIPINVGTAEATTLLYSTINLATGVATGAVGTANAAVAYAATVASGAASTAIGLATTTAATAVATVNREVANAQATAAAAVVTINRELANAIVAVNAAVGTVNTTLNNAAATAGKLVADGLVAAGAAVDNAIVIANREIAKAEATLDAALATVYREIANALVTVDAAIDYAVAEAYRYRDYVYDAIDNLPTADELVWQVEQAVNDAIEPYREPLQRLWEQLQYWLENPSEVIDRVIGNPLVDQILWLLPCVKYACM